MIIKANLHLSIKDTIANACDLNNREEIVANVVSKENVAVDFAEVVVKDQFISRSDMWRLKTHLKDTCAYVGKGIQYSCMRASVRELLSSEQPVHSGYITANTKIVFRSRSAEYIMLFQMSREMWDFAPDGQLYFEKAVNKFLPSLFAKWRALGANHCLSMVMFSRTYYDHAELFDLEGCEDSNLLDPPMERCRMDAQQRETLLRDHEGRFYHDFYTVVCIEERSNWERVVLQLKTKFEEYPYMVNWRFSYATNPDKYKSEVLGINAIAEYSGFLEAINLAQNMLDSRHFTDRDLTRTGQSVVVISAGTGIFIVNPSLEQQTKQRMIDKGIGCDLVCVTKPPLHVVPLFIMKKPYIAKPNTGSSASSQSSGMLPGHTPNSSALLSPFSHAGASSSLLSSGSNAPNSRLATGTALAAGSGAKQRSFPSHKIAHWVYLFFHDLHVQHDHGTATRNFTTTSTMPDFLLQNNDCGGIVLPLKMSPFATVSPCPGILAPSTSSSSIRTNSSSGDASISGGTSKIDTMHHNDSSASATISPRSESPSSSSSSIAHHEMMSKNNLANARSTSGSPLPANASSDTLSESDRLGMMHHMDLEVPTISAEASRAEQLAAMMDAYDAGLFLAPSKTSENASRAALHGSGSDKTPRSSLQLPSTPHLPHSSSMSQLNSPSAFSQSPSSANQNTSSSLITSRGQAAPHHPSSGARLTPSSSTSLRPNGQPTARHIRQPVASSPSTPLTKESAAVDSSTQQGTPSASVTSNAAEGSVATGLVTPGTSLTSSFVNISDSLGNGAMKTPSKTQESGGNTTGSVSASQTPIAARDSISNSVTGTTGVTNASIGTMSNMSGAAGTSTHSLSKSNASTPLSRVQTPQNAVPDVIELNPFSLELKPAPPASNRRRWEHLWARHSIQFDFLESDPSGPHWKSLTQPASLPLTTSYFPSPKELKDNFQFYSHSVDPDDSVHPMSLEEHLSEHIAQRLVQGAQIMLPDGAAISASAAFLSAGNSFHQLSIKKPNIIVNFYGAKNKVLDHERIRYKYFLWTEHTSRRLVKEIDLHYKSSIHYPWNSLDQLLSGYELEFMDNYNFWNVNMMLVPIDSKMAASAAISGFNKFKEVLSQRMVKLSDPAFGPMKVNVHVSPAAQAAEEASKREREEQKKNASFGPSSNASSFSSSDRSGTQQKEGSGGGGSGGGASSGKFGRDPSFGAIAGSSFSSLPELIDSHNTLLILAAIKESNLVNERYFKSERPEQDSFVFIASKVVDWITTHVNVRNRPEAIAICEDFTQNGTFLPVSLPRGSGFRDGANYYSIVDPSTIQANSQHEASAGGKFSASVVHGSAIVAPTPVSTNSGGPITLGSTPLDRRAITPGPYPASQVGMVVSPSSSLAPLRSTELSSNSAPGEANAHLELGTSSQETGESSASLRRGSLGHQSHSSGPSHGHSSAHHHQNANATVPGYIQPGSHPVEGSVLDFDTSAASSGAPAAVGSVNIRTHASEEYWHPVQTMMTNLPSSEPGIIRLAMDASKTDRYEWVNVVYDTVFDPSVAYEFQFQWLSCTGCVLSDFITQLTRKAKSFGFALIQIPVKHDVVHSFLSPRKDSFAWSELSTPHQLAVCHVLVKFLDFLPRKRPNQFIHRSGVIIIDISNNIFQWTVNWTDVNAYTTAQNYQLLKRFRDFMTQVTLLKKQSAMPGQSELSYNDFVGGLVQKVAPFSSQNWPSASDSAGDV